MAEAVGILRYESTKGERMKAARFLAAVRLEAVTVAYVSEAMTTVTFWVLVSKNGWAMDSRCCRW